MSADTKSKGCITMSEQEFKRLEVIQNYLDGKFSREQGCSLLGLKKRQFSNLVRDYKVHGKEGLISGKRGKPSNRRHKKEIKDVALALIRNDFYDYGPTLAAEKLLEYNLIGISKETARQWMISEGIWIPKPVKKQVLHQPRPRRECYGELIQIDGSEHQWFGKHADYCTLIVFIDDATSNLQSLYFCPAETTHAYFNVLKKYLLKYGKPVCFYNDKHTVFMPTTNQAGLTQFGRALKTLNIKDIPANSPQAKGRVERANGTLQDRLVKDMKYHGIVDMDKANNFVDEIFLDDYNRRFAKLPISPINVHRPLLEAERTNLDFICTIQTVRTISKQLTVRYKNILINIKEPRKVHTLRQEKVIVTEDEHGDIAVYHNHIPLQFELHYDHNFIPPIQDRKEIQEVFNKMMLQWTKRGDDLH